MMTVRNIRKARLTYFNHDNDTISLQKSNDRMRRLRLYQSALMSATANRKSQEFQRRDVAFGDMF